MGSSPRVRGTRVGQQDRRSVHGIIPACAGNTRRATSQASRLWDHPRVCGEHSTIRRTCSSPTGSSPRVRGTRQGGLHRIAELGIIPACAGNTDLQRGGNLVTWDHPRVCGEHYVDVGEWGAAPGSSPHVRGTRRRWRMPKLLYGIIPACAGNTCTTARTGATRRDHPRVCGEHVAEICENPEDTGSSPRVRGTLRRERRPLLRHGIIPACAGNTGCHPPNRPREWDHPRVCGEHASDSMESTPQVGSSPRVRGTRRRRAGPRGRLGIIPACAGNTDNSGSEASDSGDHPRVCGEHPPRRKRTARRLGSSPRVRGTLLLYRRRHQSEGIIPACAGNTRRR